MPYLSEEITNEKEKIIDDEKELQKKREQQKKEYESITMDSDDD